MVKCVKFMSIAEEHNICSRIIYLLYRALCYNYFIVSTPNAFDSRVLLRINDLNRA